MTTRLTGPDGAATDLDRETFDRFRAGDEEAMCQVVRLYHRRLIGFARLFVPSNEMAEEIAQETFLAAYRQREELRSPDTLRAWLFQIAKRKSLKEMDRKRHHLEEAVEDEKLVILAAGEEPTQSDGLQRDRAQVHLQEALGQLNEQDRELITLRYFGELPIKDISQTLGMPMGSVGVKLGRALGKVRKYLESKGLGIGDLLK